MTDHSIGTVVDGPPVYALPDRPALDAESAATLALMGELDTQLAGQDVAVVINPQPLARAALAAVGDFPRIPEWTGDPRSIGGGSTPADPQPQPSITVEPEVDDRGTPRTAHVRFTVDATTIDGEPVTDAAVVPVRDAEQWALAVLAACRAAGNEPGYPET